MFLIIYDADGYVLSQMQGKQGDFREPKEVPFQWVEVPSGSYVSKMNTAVTPHEAVFEALPVPETVLLAERVTFMEDAINEILLG